MTKSWVRNALVLSALVAATVAAADRHPTNASLWLSSASVTAASSASYLQDTQPAEQDTAAKVRQSSEYDDLGGPYFLRSADPEEPGEIALKFKYEYVRETDDEEHEVELIIEWGMAENWEFIFELPVQIGDGRVEGNGDITEFGFHTRLWEEGDWMPAFAVRNLIRIPTGYHSDGVDYTLRGLFTKTLVPDVLRMHFNPFATTINGNLEEEERNFRWGMALGVDYKMAPELRLVADYLHQNSEEYGNRNQHSMELGLDWEFADDQMISVATEFELDGDKAGDNFAARVQYMIEIPGPNLSR